MEKELVVWAGFIPLWRAVGKRWRLRYAGDIAHQTPQSTGVGLTIPRLARPI